VIQARARAKLNLALQILGRTDDGFHSLRSVMIALELADDLSLEFRGRHTKLAGDRVSYGVTEIGLVVVGGGEDVPRDESNLVMKAARAWLGEVGAGPERLAFHLRKRIPPGGGLGGGSADAAAVMALLSRVPGLALPKDRAFAAAARVGSDVPFALFGGAAMAEGRGERLRPLVIAKPLWAVLVRPPLSVSTPWCYRRWDEMFLGSDGRVRRDGLRTDPDAALRDLEEGLASGDVARVANAMFNDLMPPVLDAHPHLADIPRILNGAGCLGALMTGSGSCFFGLAQSRAQARKAAAEARRRDLGLVWITRTASGG